MADPRHLTDVELVARALCCGDEGGCRVPQSCLCDEDESGYGPQAVRVVSELRKNNRLIVPPYKRPCDQRGEKGECLTCSARANERCRYADSRPDLT